MFKRMFPSNNLLILPSWGKILGYPILGSYKNHNITNILADSVIFLSGLECTIKNNNDTCHYIFGIGYYYVKFQIDHGKYIIDKRPLTALCIPEFVDQYLTKSKDITFMEDTDMILKELVYKIPLTLTNKTDQQITFLKGTLNREIFIPYKELLVDFMSYIQQHIDIQYPIIHHRILSAAKENYNKILISNQLQEKFKQEYLETTAGLYGISTEAKEILGKEFTFMELTYIEKVLKQQELVFSKIHFDPVYPFSLIENSDDAFLAENQSTPISTDGLSILAPHEIQKGLIQTAFQFSIERPWPEEYARRTLESWGISTPKPSKPQIALTEQKNFDLSPEYQKMLASYKQGPTESNAQFKFGFQKNPRVEQRILPPMPDESITVMLKFLEKLILEEYEMIEIGNAFGMVRDKIKDLRLHTDYIWEMSKITNILQKEKFGLGLNQKDKEKYLEDLRTWIGAIEEEEKKVREKLKQKQEEKERIELEKQKKLQQEKDRIERQHQEHLRLEQNRIQREQEEKLRVEQETLRKEQEENLRLEQERLKHEEERIRQEKSDQQKKEQQERMRQEKETLPITVQAEPTPPSSNLQLSPVEASNQLLHQYTEVTGKITSLKGMKFKAKAEKKANKLQIKELKQEAKSLKKKIKQAKKALKK